jgi:hypothetical protein
MDMSSAATTATQMPAESVARLLASTGGDAWIKTLRNAVKGAKRDGQDRYVGFTHLTYFIEKGEPATTIGLRFIAKADGTVLKVA